MLLSCEKMWKNKLRQETDSGYEMSEDDNFSITILL